MLHDNMDSKLQADKLVSAKQINILSNQISGMMLKFMSMIILAGQAFPADFDKQTIQHDFIEVYNA